MRRPHDTLRLTAVAACSAAALLAAGCGEDDSYSNDPRPPSPVVVTAAVVDDEVSVSPSELGAGPVNLVVTNQTDAAQRLTLERDEVGERPFEQQTSPINPHGTASLKADLDPGTYEVRVESRGIKPAKLRIGPERESAQDELLLP